MVEGSEMDTSNPSTSQPTEQSCRPKLKGLSRPESEDGKPVDTKSKTRKETKIPSYSTPRAGESRPIPRKPRFSREDFIKRYDWEETFLVIFR